MLQSSEKQMEELDKSIKEQKKLQSLRILLIICFAITTVFAISYIKQRRQTFNEYADKVKENNSLIAKIIAHYDSAQNPSEKTAYAYVISQIKDYSDKNLLLTKKKAILYFQNAMLKDSSNIAIQEKLPIIDVQKNKNLINDLDKSDALDISLRNARQTGNTNPKLQLDTQQLSVEYQQLNDQIKATGSPTVDSTINLIANINSAINKQTAGTKSSAEVLQDYGTSWFKTGYFLQFDDMRILLQYLDKQLGIQVQVCQTKGSEICSESNSIVTKKWVSYDNPLAIIVGDSKYQISLQSIDHAGKNPFKLAAYINVVKLAQ